MSRTWAMTLCAILVGVACGRTNELPRDSAAPPPELETEPQILFGDLHVHTTYSWDAFLFSIPLSGGEGAHPPDDACDFARYCANLDFYALTDHAESLSRENWEASKESVRRCNERSGDSDVPDVVAFTGFEWTQMGQTPDTHWGHRCVVFRDTEDETLPARPIAAGDRSRMQMGLAGSMRGAGEVGFAEFLESLSVRAYCEESRPSRDLPLTCAEVATTPASLSAKLDEWDAPALVIPHGTSWGIYTPATSSMAKHLDPEQFDAGRQRLIEIMSGHGNSEEYRTWREFDVGEGGEKVCRPPTGDYLPCCWQAGEIARESCEDPDSETCDGEVARARNAVMDSFGIGVATLFPDVDLERWLDCGQCRDCFKPSFSHRPRESVQYGMSLSHFDPRGDSGDPVEAVSEPLRFRYGFVASSDGHSGRPGTGYKQIERFGMMTDGSPPPDSQEMVELRAASLGPVDNRAQSFLFPGGLVAVHSRDRTREAIWNALENREVYGTSGPRIALWFDLIRPDGSRQPMGSEVEMATSPVFEVRAQGSLEQLPGCSDEAHRGLGSERLEFLCRGECYRPSDVRRVIDRIEVVRIRPQREPGEPIEGRIEDPWKVIQCSPDPKGCVARFDDSEFSVERRDTLYYVRAVEVPSLQIHGDPLGTRFDRNGNAVSIDDCGWNGGNERSPNCLAPSEERAWSSPIFVDHRPSSAG
ncbi:DUF3604 domain-containing protein [Myxococcota bacterium]|nr:DUF3604 domain-containing protein [Myxococcota bacterium]